jgi:hypothetical protein
MRRTTALILSLSLLALSACGGKSADSEPDTSVLEAERIPTLNAQLTQYAIEQGGTLPSNDPAAVATLLTPLSDIPGGEQAPPDTSPQPPPTQNPGSEGAAPTRAPDSGGSASVSGAVDGGDGYNTSRVDVIRVGETVSGVIDWVGDAHNWEFTGTAGQTVTVQVDGDGRSDPRLRLIGPNGVVVAENDDGGGGFNALIRGFKLPSAGTYTIRIDMWTAGAYTLTLQ